MCSLLQSPELQLLTLVAALILVGGQDVLPLCPLPPPYEAERFQPGYVSQSDSLSFQNLAEPGGATRRMQLLSQDAEAIYLQNFRKDLKDY